MNLIRLDILIPINNGMVVTEESQTPGGLAKQLASESRIPSFEQTHINNIQIAIGPSKHLDPIILGLDNDVGLIQLSLRILESNFDRALNSVRELIELTIDHLSFQIQEPLFPCSLSLLDVSKSIAIGDKRQYMSMTDPMSFLLPKYFTSQLDFSTQSSTQFIPTLAGLRTIENRTNQICLWWYIKSLQTPYLIDRLSFLFIIVDIISKPHKKGPYKTSCNHEISNCPVCAVSIEKPLIGDSVKEYMKNHGFSESEAGELWNFRQIVHGKDLFDYKKMQNASNLITRLRMVVFNDMKGRLGIYPESLPKMDTASGAVISQNIIMTGTREIDAKDIEIEKEFDNNPITTQVS